MDTYNCSILLQSKNIEQATFNIIQIGKLEQGFTLKPKAVAITSSPLCAFYRGIYNEFKTQTNVCRFVDSINSRDVQTKNVVNNVDMSSLRAP